MLRATLVTNRGPIALVGLNDQNILRLQAGMPLDIGLKDITPPGSRINRLVLHLAHTYAEVLDDWEKGGIPVNEEMRIQAHLLDASMEKKERNDGASA